MKRLLLLSLTILLFSCSSNDDDNTLNYSINPPNWIQGYWKINGTTGGFAFDFKADDFCYGAHGFELTCWKEQAALDDDFSVYEEVSDTRYFVSLYYEGSENEFEFNKLSDTTMTYSGFELVKQ
jgi:hypothetical protein